MTTVRSGPYRTAVQLGVLAVLFGGAFPFARLGVGAGGNPFTLITVDFAIAVVVMLAVSLLTRSPHPTARDLATSMGVGALLIGGINLPLFWGVQYATGGAAAIVYALSPMLSVLFGLALGKRAGLTLGQSLAMGLGLLGVVVLVLTSAGTGVLTSVWAIVAFGVGATCQGTGSVVAARLKPAGETQWGLTFEFAGGGVASALVMGSLTPTIALPDSLAVLASILFVSLGTLVAGYVIFHDLVHRAGPVRANLVTYLNPIVAIAIGVAAFSEPFEPLELAGLVLILIALVLLQRPSRRPSVAPRAAPRESADPSSQSNA